MKYLVLLSFAVALAMVEALPQKSSTYTARYDSINVDDILNNDHVFDHYFKCMMDEGRCTAEGSELKRVLPDALRTNCEKCTERQRSGTDRILAFLVKRKKKQWNELKQKYDPKDIYVKKYRETAAARGITI